MADVNFKKTVSAASGSAEAPGHSSAGGDPDLRYDLIELLFFAYRDFTSDPDAVLAEFEFGRAHHRVLHFVDRNPAIRVTDLLGILRITKQSLGRVLKQLVDEGFIEQVQGETDRRQRLLNTTPKGHALARKLATLQSHRLERAIKSLPDGTDATVRQFLFNLVDPISQPETARLIRELKDFGDTRFDTAFISGDET